MRGSCRLLVLVSVAFVNWDCATPQEREAAATRKKEVADRKRGTKAPIEGGSESNPEEIGKITGRTADNPLLPSDPLLAGGIVARSPVFPDGVATGIRTNWNSDMTKALSWVAGAGSTTREVAIFVQYTPILDINPVTVKRPPQQGQEVKEGRSTTRSGENTLENENRSNMMLLAIAAPRKATDSAAPFPPELDSNTFNVLTSVRRNSPNYRKIEATIEGVPHWWILSPGWIVGTPDLNPTTFLAELYSADPDTGATPLDAAVIARRNGTAPWQPTGGYLFRGDRLMRATAVLENGLPARVDAVDVPEPPVEDFLISKEVSIPCARQRTGVLLAAKNRTLPKMIREGTTSSLADLATRVEKTILDLNYNREQTNSLAQQAIESGGKAGGLPELSLAYKERIEVLKPMVAAIKEELANRGK